MKKVTIYVGLPGSGKTQAMKSMGDSVIKIDDVSVHYDYQTIASVLSSLSHFHELAIADAHFCLDGVLTEARNIIKQSLPDHEQHLVFFANDPEACLVNVETRKESGDYRSVTNFINFVSTVYKPQGEVVPVFKKQQ